ncbi:MAG TPA: DUF1573 domain-containing protein [Chthoniobacterales bacterium]
MKNLLCIAGLLLALTGPARAALVWENPVADLHPSISDETAVAHFKYKNSGDKPVTIKQVLPSCGCTTAAPPKEAIAPGASGEIVATFHIGDRTGLQTKTIRVLTDPPNEQNTQLTLNATVPSVLEIKPVFLFWTKTEAFPPKKIEAKIGGDFPVTKLKLTCTDPDITATAKLLPNEKAFEITVTPKPINRPINASLFIEPDFPKGKPKHYSVYLRIDAHPGAPTATPMATATPLAAATPK